MKIFTENLMNYKNWILATSFALISGCNSPSAIVDEVIKAEQSHSNPNTTEIDKVINKVINKHIPVGMKIENALKKLDEQGFKITEHDALGFRKYPNGKLRLYADEEVATIVKKRLGDTKFEYYAERFQIAQLLSSAVEITIKSDGEKVLDVNAYVNAY